MLKLQSLTTLRHTYVITIMHYRWEYTLVQFLISTAADHTHTLWSSSHALITTTNRNRYISPWKVMLKSMCNSNVQKSQRWGQSKCPLTVKLTRNLVKSFNGKLNSKENEWTTSTSNIMDDSHKVEQARPNRNLYVYISLEKEMATHSSILAWKIPWTEEPAGLQSMGSQRVRHSWAT